MVRVVCEIGKNFITKESDTVSSCLAQAKLLVKEAKQCGVSVVKFQAHAEDELVKRDPVRHEWIRKNIRLTPVHEFWVPLKRYCDQLEIQFLVTPMSLRAAQKISPLVVEWKIGSADVVDEDLLRYLYDTNKPIILSTGMSMLHEVDRAVTICDPDTILHCVSIYPCPENKANLSMLKVLRNRYPNSSIGFSDHTMGYRAALSAVCMGAQVIEKHFTLTPNAYGPDHKISMLPEQLREMVFAIRDVETMIGDGLKTVEPEEAKLQKIFRYENPVS